MLRGEAITWLYTMAILDSIYMLEIDLKQKTKAELLQCKFLKLFYYCVTILS